MKTLLTLRLNNGQDGAESKPLMERKIRAVALKCFTLLLVLIVVGHCRQFVLFGRVSVSFLNLSSFVSD